MYSIGYTIKLMYEHSYSQFSQKMIISVSQVFSYKLKLYFIQIIQQ